MSKEPTLQKISIDDQKAIPPARGTAGVNTEPVEGWETYPISGKHYNPMEGTGGGAGIMQISAGAEPRTWTNFEKYDILYCDQGELVVTEHDDEGNELVEVRATKGEYVILKPGASSLTLNSGNVPTTVRWVNNDPNSSEPWDPAKAYGEEYAEKLQALE